MRKNGFTLVELVVTFLVLGLLVAAIAPEFRRFKFEKEVIATEKSYDWSYPLSPAKEFGESDSYSMVWIGESGWIEKRFLLVKAKKSHMDHGRIPYLLKAVSDVEKKGYTIVSREFLSSATPGIKDSLLLEIRPPENTGNIGKRHP